MSIDLLSLGVDCKEKIIKLGTRDPVFCYDSEKITDVINKIVSTDHRRIPIILRNKEVVGVLTKRDILDAFLRGEKFEEKVNAIMTRDLITCDENDSIAYALNKFKIARRGGLPIVNDKKLVGIVSERDFIKKLLLQENCGVKVADVMTKKPFFISPNLSILDCLKIMVNTKYRRLPVVENGTLVGLVTSNDMLKYIRDNDYNVNALDEDIEKLMIKNVMTVNKDDDLTDVAKRMVSAGVGGFMIVGEHNKLEGIITERDILEEIECIE